MFEDPSKFTRPIKTREGPAYLALDVEFPVQLLSAKEEVAYNGTKYFHHQPDPMTNLFLQKKSCKFPTGTCSRIFATPVLCP